MLNGLMVRNIESRNGNKIANQFVIDYERTRAQMFSRAFRLLEVVKAMDNAQDGQMEWAEGLG